MDEPKFLSFEQIVEKELERLRSDKKSIRVIKSVVNINELHEYHMTFGMYLRNEYKLWDERNPITMLDYEAKVVNGIDVNEKHPDYVSFSIMKEIVKRIQSGP